MFLWTFKKNSNKVWLKKSALFGAMSLYPHNIDGSQALPSSISQHLIG